MNVCIISDTHGKHKQTNSEKLIGDVIIHCGDFTSRGYEHEINDFFKWFSNLKQFKYKIIIAGNHDLMFEDNSILAKSLIPDNIIYLEDSGVEINGINFYGTPAQPIFFDWAFNKPEHKLIQHWEAIPDNTDVLITHTPPYSVLDYVVRDNKHVGSKSLYNNIINRIKPRLNCFGHIHDGHGYNEINGIKFVNASLLDERYYMTYQPINIEI